MTTPTDGEIWKMWETEEGSISLSCVGVSITALSSQVRRSGPIAYGNLLLRQYYGAVLATESYRHDVRSCDGLEGVLCELSAISLRHSFASSSLPRNKGKRSFANLPTWYKRPLSAKMVMCLSYALAVMVD